MISALCLWPYVKRVTMKHLPFSNCAHLGWGAQSFNISVGINSDQSAYDLETSTKSYQVTNRLGTQRELWRTVWNRLRDPRFFAASRNVRKGTEARPTGKRAYEPSSTAWWGLDSSPSASRFKSMPLLWGVAYRQRRRRPAL